MTAPCKRYGLQPIKWGWRIDHPNLFRKRISTKVKAQRVAGRLKYD
jgi:hypothetical protein